jgi:L-ascorbate metabolism protein UlaG (beta-lactamase superfamily)
MLDFNGVKFHWLGHDGYRIIAGDKTIYIDPYQLSKAQQNRNDADILLISHNHFDHLSMDDLKNVLGKKTAVPARHQPGIPGWEVPDAIGLLIEAEGLRIYHTGDTDDIPEMSSVKPDIALVPVSGTYVMTAEEAAKAVNEKIKPSKLAIPMHYGAIVGSDQDAARFKQLVSVCPVQVLDRE